MCGFDTLLKSVFLEFWWELRMILRISGGSCNYYKARESRTVSKDTKENKGQILFFFSFFTFEKS